MVRQVKKGRELLSSDGSLSGEDSVNFVCSLRSIHNFLSSVSNFQEVRPRWSFVPIYACAELAT